MNFDVRISDAWEEFMKKEEKNNSKNKLGTDKTNTIKDLAYANGDKYDYVEDDIDDALYRTSKAQKRINKKLKDSKLMTKLQREAEEYVRENPDEFKKPEHHSKFKLDIVDNRITGDVDGNKKKARKEKLDQDMAEAVHALVMKRFRRRKKDIIMEDDEEAMLVL
jgi:stress-induced morphogen